MAVAALRPPRRWSSAARYLLLSAAVLMLLSGSRVAFVTPPPVLRPPVVVLPGFGNDAQDYSDLELEPTGGTTKDGGLKGRLHRRGFEHVHIVPVARADWLRVALGLFDEDFRAGSAPPDTAFGWYLDRVDETAAEASAASGGERVLLLAHSAGGWLARAALGRSGGSLAERTRALVTLGSPHRAPPLEPPGDDQTRGALSFVDNSFPGAFLKNVEYVTVAGAAVVGDGEAERGTPEKEGWISYRRLVGRGDVPGDGIVPLENAHLEGATQVTLPAARHSIGTPDEWYGAEGVIDTWLPQVTLSLARQAVVGTIR
mmetsp:Transcript_37390/g.93960  ORF Transcript_37390/g.93960 Transcript_37390/m.93960 type:complete len:315 (-) Transcript_37390:256-1200(-)